MFDEDIDRIYLIEFEIESTTGTTRSDVYLDLHIKINREYRIIVRTKLYEDRDYLHFPVVNFPLIFSNIPAVDLISRPYGSYNDVLIANKEDTERTGNLTYGMTCHGGSLICWTESNGIRNFDMSTRTSI